MSFHVHQFITVPYLSPDIVAVKHIFSTSVELCRHVKQWFLMPSNDLAEGLGGVGTFAQVSHNQTMNF